MLLGEVAAVGVSDLRLRTCCGQAHFFGSAKTDPVRFKWGFGEVLLKDRFAFKNLIKVLYLRGENCLRALFKNPFKLDRVSFSASDFSSSYMGVT